MHVLSTLPQYVARKELVLWSCYWYKYWIYTYYYWNSRKFKKKVVWKSERLVWTLFERSEYDVRTICDEQGLLYWPTHFLNGFNIINNLINMNIFDEKYKCINDLIVAQEKMCKFRKKKHNVQSLKI